MPGEVRAGGCSILRSSFHLGGILGGRETELASAALVWLINRWVEGVGGSPEKACLATLENIEIRNRSK